MRGKKELVVEIVCNADYVPRVQASLVCIMYMPSCDSLFVLLCFHGCRRPRSPGRGGPSFPLFLRMPSRRPGVCLLKRYCWLNNSSSDKSFIKLQKETWSEKIYTFVSSLINKINKRSCFYSSAVFILIFIWVFTKKISDWSIKHKLAKKIS